MAKHKKKKATSKKIHQPTVASITENRTGGAVALTGFDYQCLYSCYVLLVNLVNETGRVRLEGTEDIDCEILEDIQEIRHLQVKYSSQKQDASYLKSILKNYLEVYLCDPNNEQRFFVLVYDFNVADGHFKTLVNHDKKTTLPPKTKEYCQKVISAIEEKNPTWAWELFDFDGFISQLRFEAVEYKNLLSSVSQLLIERYSIASGNELLYVHSLFYYCFTQMRARAIITKAALDRYVQDISDAINKGADNPAIHWFDRIRFEEVSPTDDDLYYEGRKATPADIVAGFPIPRPNLEQELKQSIEENTITVIKSSSGQGKTTLAWRVAFELKDRYSVYVLTWCMDAKELDHMVEFIQSRIKTGELPLIIIDNLDAQLREWNSLAQALQARVGTNYKLLLTTRENDWYTYSGDQSNLRRLKIHSIFLDSLQAQEIFVAFKSKGRLHATIHNWQEAWERVKDEGLLIEYVYLLTHGEMLADRIATQMKELSQQEDTDIKYDLLQKICFADVLGIRLSAEKLSVFYLNNFKKHITGIIQHFENEFLVKNAMEHVYISGLHPVRSQHLLDFIHQYHPKAATIIDLIDIIDDDFVAKLYANLPLHTDVENRESLYQSLVNKTKDKSYEYFLNALRGLFSGSIYQYYSQHKELFDDVNHHGGLYAFLAEINPYSRFEKFDTEVQTITSMHEILPDDENLSYLKTLVDSMERFDIRCSDYYIYAHHLYHETLSSQPLKAITSGFSELAFWLVNINTQFCLVSLETADFFWKGRTHYSSEFIAELMLSWYLAQEEDYRQYILPQKESILLYLKSETRSAKLYENTEDNSIHTEYLLLPSETQSAMTESVKRISLICKFLPIYDFYCSAGIMPNIEMLESIQTHDDSVKRMPRRNVIIMFHQEFANLWTNTVMTQYEAPTVFAWLEHWAKIRAAVVNVFKRNIKIIDNRVNQRNTPNHILAEFDQLRNKAIDCLRAEYPYPRQMRPFEKTQTPEKAKQIAQKYFPSIRNYITQAVGLLLRDEKKSRLALINLRTARKELTEMQDAYRSVASQAGYDISVGDSLDNSERLWLQRLLDYCSFYLDNPHSRIASQHYVSSWTASKTVKAMEQIQNALKAPEFSMFEYECPTAIIDDGTLLTLPLIVNSVDITDNEIATALILSLLPLASSNVDFILIIFRADKIGFVKPAGLRFNRDFLEKARQVLENNDESHMENAFTPLPIGIKKEYLAVFDQKYTLESPLENPQGYDLLFEQLWKYSQLQHYLIEPSETFVLEQLRSETKHEIDILFNNLTDTKSELYKYASDLSHKVLSGICSYDDAELNVSLGRLLQQEDMDY